MRFFTNENEGLFRQVKWMIRVCPITHRETFLQTLSPFVFPSLVITLPPAVIESGEHKIKTNFHLFPGHTGLMESG